MYKNFLTHQFAVNYVREASITSIADDIKAELMKSAQQMLDHFSRSVQTQDRTEEAKLLFVSLLSLRDCKIILDRAGVRIPELDGNYEMLHRRLEQLCADATYNGSRTGQMKLFG